MAGTWRLTTEILEIGSEQGAFGPFFFAYRLDIAAISEWSSRSIQMKKVERLFHRRALRLDRNPMQRRMVGVRRLAQPPAEGSAGDPAIQLDDGGVAGRLDRADPLRIGPRRTRRPRRASPSPLPAGGGCARARATFPVRLKRSSASRPTRIRHRYILMSGV